ncbi:MAG: hypothetical protein JXL97_09685 [Bacteroidales bacterium]|nr:hypothetical protein [Bacteroidales bacterium]
MKKSFILFFLLPFVLIAQEKRDYFDYLVEAKYKDWQHTGVYLQKDYVSASYLTPLNEEYEPSYPIAFVSIGGETEKMLLCYTDGPSGDPAFEFYRYGSNKELEYQFSLAGVEIFVPGNGFMYTTGHTNNMFDKHKKFEFDGASVNEVAQPFYAVGMKTKTLKNIQLYSDYNCTQKLAVVGANSNIEIVAAEYSDFCRKYLIKTPFGLMGWWELDREYPMSEEIEGLFYAGD